MSSSDDPRVPDPETDEESYEIDIDPYEMPNPELDDMVKRDNELARELAETEVITYPTDEESP